MPKIDLGTAVRVRDLARKFSVPSIDGVVIEVVPACGESAIVATGPVRYVRFLVQCDYGMVLTKARDLLVDAW